MYRTAVVALDSSFWCEKYWVLKHVKGRDAVDVKL